MLENHAALISKHVLRKTRAVLVFCDRAQKQCRPPPAITEEGE